MIRDCFVRCSFASHERFSQSRGTKRRRLSAFTLSLHVVVPGQSVSRILSSAGLRFTGNGPPSKDGVPCPSSLGRSRLGDHLSGPLISQRLGAANPRLERSEPLLVPAWPCSWRRLPGRGHCCPRRWSLTPPFQPYCFRSGMFLWPDRQVSPPRDFPRRHALWSADFPLYTEAYSERPTNLEKDDTSPSWHRQFDLVSAPRVPGDLGIL